MGLRLDSVPPNPRKGWCFYIIKQQVGSLNNLLNCQGISLTYIQLVSAAVCGVIIKSVQSPLIRLHKPALMHTVQLVQKLGAGSICWQLILETCIFSLESYYGGTSTQFGHKAPCWWFQCFGGGGGSVRLSWAL